MCTQALRLKKEKSWDLQLVAKNACLACTKFLGWIPSAAKQTKPPKTHQMNKQKSWDLIKPTIFTILIWAVLNATACFHVFFFFFFFFYKLYVALNMVTTTIVWCPSSDLCWWAPFLLHHQCKCQHSNSIVLGFYNPVLFYIMMC